MWYFFEFSYFNLNLRSIGVLHSMHKCPKIDASPSRFSDEVIWFMDATLKYNLNCKKCRKQDTAECEKCIEKRAGKYLLLKNMKPEQLRNSIYKMVKNVSVNDINDALWIYDLQKNFEVLTPGRLRYLEEKYSTHFYFYREKIDKSNAFNLRKCELQIERKPHGVKFERKLHFKLRENFPTTKNGQIEKFELILDRNLLPKTYICEKIPTCRYQTDRRSNFERHLRGCGVTNISVITSKQKFYGDEMTGRGLKY